ncbi:MAG: substrate-binding domain-containing protein [Rhodobacteraceae bacterium]|nr:substrate-binding domain-containing protein [Paracoccaceae bacterium]
MFLRNPKSLAAGLAAILSLTISPLHAEPITLNSLDGTVSMTGELLEYDGVTYLLGMLIGDISLDASQVTCEGAGCPNFAAGLTEFSIAGSGAIGDTLLPTLIEVFALDRGGDLEVSTNVDGSQKFDVLEADGSVYASITIQTSNSIDGFSGLMDSTAVIGMSSRRISSNEAAAFDLSGKGQLDSPAQEQIIALDGLIAAVNQNNPVQALSIAQMGAIFGGEITNWNQLGGHDAPIALYRRDAAADTATFFSDTAMSAGGQSYANSAIVLDTDEAVSDAVAADENGIGITLYSQERNARAVAIRSVCGQIFEPSAYAIKTEEYPLTQRMYLYTSKTGLPDIAAEFLDFASSPAAQSVISRTGFVDQSASRADLDGQGRRLAQAIVSSAGRSELLQLQDLASIMLDAERLSFTLHYAEGGALDARALADIERLAAMIRNGEFASRQMLVFGFSDNTGAANAQLVSTQAIAQDVRDQIVVATGRANLGNLRISPIGYGHIMPLGCNETARGQRGNNRVEIWIK